MVTKYIKYKCIGGNPLEPSQCTTRWSDELSCSIPLSGKIGNDFHNLMIMIGNEQLINEWVNINSDKVTIITKEEANQIGQQIVIPNTIIESKDEFSNEEYILKAASFDIEHPELLWEKI